MYQKISRDVKLAAVKLYERQHLSLQDILACVGQLGFSESTFWRVLKLWRKTGNVVSPTCSLLGFFISEYEYTMRVYSRINGQ
ncbi:hypothetical protein DFJ58DRAFT_760864 [Suillus subalutaceus]|uniref:uncharacterized protein n=1 Tax=Suillus subalutaceus TaxID=48586 RepID=UPI001B87A29E|nr:uncharacterized protein DFJ58DRAFT_760864 [Suillus subalutaceus]KAG1873040.1 hypothetical protein DFJ58DRAFT_760864 [Suillus subalutaceus]